MNAEIVKELDKILPVVVRVHAEHHPELKQVGELYTALKATPTVGIARQLHTVTNGFTVPADACPTFRKAYQDLAALVQEIL